MCRVGKARLLRQPRKAWTSAVTGKPHTRAAGPATRPASGGKNKAAKRPAEAFVDPATAALTPASAEPFWRTTPLEAMTASQWESLCDGCGRCCLNKLEEEDTGKIHLTTVACRLLDTSSCQCSDYHGRFKEVPDCVVLTPENVRVIKWLPPTCGYRLVAQGQDLEPWHPLRSGRPESVHEAGVSVRGWAKSERRIKAANFERYIIEDFLNAEALGAKSKRRP